MKMSKKCATTLAQTYANLPRTKLTYVTFRRNPRPRTVFTPRPASFVWSRIAPRVIISDSAQLESVPFCVCCNLILTRLHACHSNKLQHEVTKNVVHQLMPNIFLAVV